MKLTTHLPSTAEVKNAWSYTCIHAKSCYYSPCTVIFLKMAPLVSSFRDMVSIIYWNLTRVVSGVFEKIAYYFVLVPLWRMYGGAVQHRIYTKPVQPIRRHAAAKPLTIHMHMDMADRRRSTKPTCCIHNGSKRVNPSKSRDLFFHDHDNWAKFIFA